MTVFTKIFTEKSCILITVKCVLGVHSKSSNLACVGELSGFLIYMDVCKDILKYYFYASQKTDDSLIGETLQTSKHLHEKGAKSWYTGVITILTELNLNETNYNQAKFSLKNMYKNVWLTKLENEALFRKRKLRRFTVSSHFFSKGSLSRYLK